MGICRTARLAGRRRRSGRLGLRLQTRSAERELDEALTALRGAAQDAVIGIDGEGVIVAWDDGAAALYGYTSDGR